MILVIGSYAMNHIEFIREPTDLDLVMTYETLQSLVKKLDLKVFPQSRNSFVGKLSNQIVEITIAWPGSTDEELLDTHAAMPSYTLYGLPVSYCSLDWLYALKMSHRFKKDSPHFLKTMEDIRWLREFRTVIPDIRWFERREKETLAKHPKLNQNKNNFFDTPGLTYIYDHDSIHQAIAIGSRPAYLEYQEDNAEVWCSKKKWNKVSNHTKLNGVLEEALVLALERSQIPYDFKPDKDWSFKHALMKVCTSITSGWFREYAWENYYIVLDRYQILSSNYTEVFKTALANNIVKSIEKGNNNGLEYTKRM